jgi:ABC-type transporter Mla MlaB component
MWAGCRYFGPNLLPTSVDVINGSPQTAKHVSVSVAFRKEAVWKIGCHVVSVLKITIETGATGVRFRLEGKLGGPWVRELEKTWHEMAAVCGTEHITLDLSEVTFVDSTGRELLEQLSVGGATLNASGCMMKCLVEEIKRSARNQQDERKC